MSKIADGIVATLERHGFEAAPRGAWHVRETRNFRRRIEGTELTQWVDFQPRFLPGAFHLGVTHDPMEKSLRTYFSRRMPKLSETFTIYGSVVNIRPLELSDLNFFDRLAPTALGLLDGCKDPRSLLAVLADPWMGPRFCPYVYWWCFRFAYLTYLMNPASTLGSGDLKPPHLDPAPPSPAPRQGSSDAGFRIVILEAIGPKEAAPFDRAWAQEIVASARDAALRASA